MFVPYTNNGTLAKQLRDNEEKLEQMTGTKLEIVERVGLKLIDLITKSNPWQGNDCQRENCLLCSSKISTNKNLGHECRKRNIVYEIKCLTCEQAELDTLENLELDEKDKLERTRNINNFKYIGETSRSAFERGWEHSNDLAKLSTRSHMLKHIVITHPDENIENVKFGMRVIKFCTTSFERQILESVTIQQERKKHTLLNSRTEYNRCSLPRLTTNMGDKIYKDYEKELKLEKQEEIVIESKIRELRKTRNKERLHPTRENGPKKKKRKNDNETYVTIQETWGNHL